MGVSPFTRERLLTQRPLPTRRQQLTHSSRLQETFRLDMFVEFGRVDIPVRSGAVSLKAAGYDGFNGRENGRRSPSHRGGMS